MEDGTKDHRRKMAKVIAKAWSDDAFKKSLISEPIAVLAENGITVPQGLEVKVVEQTEKLMYIVLPFKPDEDGGAWMCDDDAYDIPCARCN